MQLQYSINYNMAGEVLLFYFFFLQLATFANFFKLLSGFHTGVTIYSHFHFIIL